MKTFSELNPGDEVYYLTKDFFANKLTTQILKFSSRSVEMSGSVVLYFKNSSEMINVPAHESKHKIIPSVGHNHYIISTNRLDVEKYLKDELKLSQNYIKNLEESYNLIWEKEEKKEDYPEREIPVDNELGLSYKKGDAVFVINCENVGLFDGKNSLYFPDGDRVSINDLGKNPTNFRLANRYEIADYFEIVKSRLRDFNGKVADKIRENICSCGYRFENGELIPTKIV